MGKICPICNVYEAKHQGALNMHMYHCKIKNTPNNTIVQEKENDDVCTHDWRFLNLKSPIERKAFENGYTEVCKKCQDLKGWNE